MVMLTGESLLNFKHQSTPAYFFKWLTVELAPTILGEKPSTLLSFADSSRFPRLTFWRKYGPVFLRGAAINWTIVRETKNCLTILFYHPHSLTAWIRQAEHWRFLAEFGYKPECSLYETIECLKRRYRNGCPHEIGLLLGIPLKDVLGFMGRGEECLSCRGLWCIYGDPEPSIQVMQKIDASKAYAAWLLNNGANPRLVLLQQERKTA